MASSKTLLRGHFPWLSSPPLSLFHLPVSPSPNRVYSRVSASFSTHRSSSFVEAEPSPSKTMNRWKPMCLYYTQRKCTMMDDPLHLERFNHSFFEELQANTIQAKHIHSQNIDFLLVLDLEGKIEILEFPVLIINAQTLELVDFFHRFVRPTMMSEQRINEYIEGKYGKFGVDRYALHLLDNDSMK